MQQQQDIAEDAADNLQDLGEQEVATDRPGDQPWGSAYMNAMPTFNEVYSGARRRLSSRCMTVSERSGESGSQRQLPRFDGPCAQS